MAHGRVAGKMQFINNSRRCENAIIFMRNTLRPGMGADLMARWSSAKEN